MQETVTINGDVNIEVPLELFNETVVNNLNEYQIFDILLDGINRRKMLLRTVIERFKDDYKDDYEEIINESTKDLQHHKDTTVGLWAFDCDPKELLNKLNNSQSDANPLELGEFEELIKCWNRFCNNKNSGKSPFFQIK